MATPESTVYAAIKSALESMSSPIVDNVYPADVEVGSGHAVPCAMVFLKTGKTSGRSDNTLRNEFTFGVRVVNVASANGGHAATQSTLRNSTQTALMTSGVRAAADGGITGNVQFGSNGLDNAALVWVEFEYTAIYRG